jgi:hypothetical protein
MKTMKVALLATAALAAVSVSARADSTADLKAQLEALNARVAQLEAAPAVPTGYSLLTIADGEASTIPGFEVLNKEAAAYGPKATVIGIMPTADVPASTTIEWSGFVRAAIKYNDPQGAKASYDVPVRGELKVRGKTDTAVGEVGATLTFRAENQEGGFGNLGVNVPNAWGWWAMTPELTLGGGFTGSLGNIGYGYDGACTCYFTDNADAAFNPGDVTQMRVSYASGPLSMAIALEDATSTVKFTTVAAVATAVSIDAFGGDGNSLGVAAEVKYSGDAFNAEVSGVWHDGGNDLVSGAFIAPTDDSWQVGAGAGFSLGDMASLSLAAATGHIVNGQDFWGASILGSANLSDAVHAELAYAYKNYDNGTNTNFVAKSDVSSILGGIYYDPVSQLTIGLEAEYTNPKGSNNNVTTVDLVTVFRF